MEAAEPVTRRPTGPAATTSVAVVGGSSRAASLASLLSGIDGVTVVAICSPPSQPAGRFAVDAHITLVVDPLAVLSAGSGGVDVVLDLSEDVVTRAALEGALPPNTELLGGSAADLVWSVLDRRAGEDVPGLLEDVRRKVDELSGRLRRLSASNDARKRANEDLESRLAEVYFMHEFVKGLVAFNTVDDVCSLIVDGCAGILGAEIATVYLVDRDAWSLRLQACQGRPESAFVSEVPVSETLLGRAFSDGFIHDAEVDHAEGLSAWLTAPASIRTQVAVALRSGDETVGVLAIAWAHTRVLGSAELERLHVVADQSSLSLQNALLHAELERLSVTDRLTELFNHGYLHQRLDQEIQRATRFGRELSVVLLDIDDFKAFNDRFGHPRGDGVLRDVSSLVRENLREMDIAARYGGEEFVVVLPETDAEGAGLVAERIRASVAAHAFVGDENQLRVHKTVSVGVATFPSDAPGVDTLIERADSAMYRAKRAGKDRVETASRI